MNGGRSRGLPAGDAVSIRLTRSFNSMSMTRVGLVDACHNSTMREVRTPLHENSHDAGIDLDGMVVVCTS